MYGASLRAASSATRWLRDKGCEQGLALTNNIPSSGELKSCLRLFEPFTVFRQVSAMGNRQ